MSKLVLAMADMKENPMNIHKLIGSDIGSFGVFLVGNKVFSLSSYVQQKQLPSAEVGTFLHSDRLRAFNLSGRIRTQNDVCHCVTMDIP